MRLMIFLKLLWIKASSNGTIRRMFVSKELVLLKLFLKGGAKSIFMVHCQNCCSQM